MTGLRRHLLIRAHLLILMACLVAVPSTGFAQNGSAMIPENARAKIYGGVWECDPGFRKMDNACAGVEVFVNAYPTKESFGRSWVCLRGHQEVDETCVSVTVPQNAYLSSIGDRWICNRGFREAGEFCTTIQVPANGFLADFVVRVGMGV